MSGDISRYVTVARVQEEVESSSASARVESVPVASAFGRIAAKDVVAESDVPPLPASHMDGFAVRARGLEGGERLKVVGRVGPGERPKGALGRGEALQVATGSFVPSGADAVVPVEEAKVKGGFVTVQGPVRSGAFIFGAGADVKKGTTLLRAGSAARAQDVGMLLSLGVKKLKVFARPRVALIATGDELVSGRVRNSHTLVFAKICEAMGAEVADLGVVGDDPSKISRLLAEGLARADVVLTTGGTSVGSRDFVGDAVKRLKPQQLFHGVRMDRGRVAGVALVKGKLVVMMPGPIQGAMNAFVLFALPRVNALTGREGQAMVTARLGSRWEARKRFPDFVKVVYVALRAGPDGLAADPLTAETESMTVLTRASGFVVVPEEVREMEAGDAVSVRMVPGFSSA